MEAEGKAADCAKKVPNDHQFPTDVSSNFPANFVNSCKESSNGMKREVGNLFLGECSSGSSSGNSVQSDEERLVRREINTEGFKGSISSNDDDEEQFYWPEFSLENDILKMNDIEVLMGQEFNKVNWDIDGNEIPGIQSQWFF
ncbi:hypothetical protein COLO4_07002 [Corchorus olitorius]|uniref:Uncharacterized protein n=1 Tax=Corchorus olitorius TaxID=93759 RepID=A0A1R3KL77_9ROSI|nr:hypothetical protein COLO4_07002 [Corchorus olitorius]